MAVCIHADSVTAVSIKRRENGLPLVDWAVSSPVQPGKPLLECLDALAKNTGAESYQCSNLLAKDEYQLVLVDTPNLPQNEWKSAIRWRLKDLIDFPVTEATIDVLSIPVDKTNAQQAQSVYAVAARNKVIKDRQALFVAAKMPLSVIDIPEMAQRNIASLFESPERALALLYFDERGGLLTITAAGELYLSRRLDVSSALIAHISEDQKTALYERITLELQRTLDHFERQFRHIVLGKLLIAQVGPATSGLLAYLTSNLYVQVDVLSLDQVFDFSKTPELKTESAQQRYFLTLGAALRQEEAAQ
jgi:MSHA biogenesis protein MshI